MKLAVYAVRAFIVLTAAIAGWIIGNGLGYAAGRALDAATGNDWVSWVLLTIPLMGFVCIALAAWLGSQLARRVTTPRATGVAGAGVLVALIVGLFVVVPTAKGFCALPTADRFDAAAWRADDADWPCTDRAGMVPELLDDILAPGMSEAELRELLGPPAVDPAIAWPDRDALIWKVRCGIDCEWLVVSVDDGRVGKVELAED